ncbi:MAG: hypothetical protein M0Z28_00105 [Rhodospirillales bacterium]|nr:hypothetical protein [Rhodospirillales bacterium]
MLENALEGNVALLAAAGAATLVLPAVLPHLAPPLRAAVKSGLSLFIEAEAEAEGGIMGRLAETTVQAVLDNVGGSGSREHRQAAAQDAVRRFEATARARAQRYGWNEADSAARYRSHVAHFRRALAKARHQAPARQRELLTHAGEVLSEDW